MGTVVPIPYHHSHQTQAAQNGPRILHTLGGQGKAGHKATDMTNPQLSLPPST